MKILVVGATGNTGLPLVRQLLEGGHEVLAIVRSVQKIPADLQSNTNLQLVHSSLLDLSDTELAGLVKNCEAVVSCLGHVMSFQGMFGHPRDLVTQSVQRLCHAIECNNSSRVTKFILMNTVGIKNPDRNEERHWYERAVLWLLKGLPPHRDNETALEYLHSDISNGAWFIEWSIVRPDSLINANVSPYEVIASPSTELFTGRPTTRANVANFMKALIEDVQIWEKWKFGMPVIMDR